MNVSRAIKATERSLILGSVRAVVRTGAAVAPRRTAGAVAARFFTTSRPPFARRTFRGAPPLIHVLGVPDGTVATYRWGNAGGPTVLLAHGWNGWAQQMEPFVAPLLERGFSVLAFDHVAHGASNGDRASLPVMIRSTERLLSETPSIVGAIAHSLGAAALASVLATTRRTLGGAVLIAPPSDPRPYLVAMARALGTPEHLVPEVEAQAEAIAGVAFDRLVMRPWIARRIRTPLLIAHDVGDRDVPIAQGYAYTMGTGARLLATDGLGHTRILRDGHVIDSAINFVTRGVRSDAFALAA